MLRERLRLRVSLHVRRCELTRMILERAKRGAQFHQTLFLLCAFGLQVCQLSPLFRERLVSKRFLCGKRLRSGIGRRRTIWNHVRV